MVWLAVVGVALLDVAIFAALSPAPPRVFPRPRPNWLNPDFAPPSLSPVDGPSHEYVPAPHTPTCQLCGGGRLHAIHRES
jgi:hypothetical protein